jgi:hypothetical protein
MRRPWGAVARRRPWCKGYRCEETGGCGVATAGAAHLDCSQEHQRVEWQGIASLGVLTVVVLAATMSAAPWRLDPGLLVLAVVVGVAIADLGSGALHWTFDTWFDEEQRHFDRAVRIAREHHTRPAAILEYPFRDLVSFSAWPTLVTWGPVAALSTAAPEGAARTMLLVSSSIVLPAMFFGSHSHGLGHHWSSTGAVRLLQRSGVLMSPRHHRRHHAGEHLTHYCTFVGIMDPICDRLGFWRLLERVVARRTGAIPRRDELRRRAEVCGRGT